MSALEEKKKQMKKSKNLTDKTVENERFATRVVDLEAMLQFKTTEIDTEEQVHVNAVTEEKKTFEELPYILN
jgi:hypothetical protein